MYLFVFWIINFDVLQIFHTIKSVPCLQKGTTVLDSPDIRSMIFSMLRPATTVICGTDGIKGS